LSRKNGKAPPSPEAKHVTNRNRSLLSKKYHIEIPDDVEYIIIGEAFDDYMAADIDTARKMNGKDDKDYDGIEFID
jgi:hypothetical protein